MGCECDFIFYHHTSVYFITHSTVKILLMFQWLKYDIMPNCFRLNYSVGQTNGKT